jgi:hypothetical protein
VGFSSTPHTSITPTQRKTHDSFELTEDLGSLEFAKSRYQFENWTWVPFGSDLTPGKPADIYIKTYDSHKIVVTAKFYGMWINTTQIGSENYTIIEMPTCGHLTEPEAPELPFTSRFIEIPYDIDITPRILRNISRLENSQEYYVKPVAEPWFPGSRSNTTDPVQDATIYGGSNWYPLNINAAVTLSGALKANERMIRGHRFLAIEFIPIQFLNLRKELYVHSLIEVELQFSSRAWLPVIEPRWYSPAFEELYTSFFLSYNMMERQVTLNTSKVQSRLPYVSGCDYLIITVDRFLAGAERFAEWKTQRGYGVKIVSLEDGDGIVSCDTLGQGSGDSISDNRTTLETYIKETLGAQADKVPTYALIIGDTDHIPSHQGGYHTDDVTQDTFGVNHFASEPIPTDLHYFTIGEDDDFEPDIYYGRFSVNTTAELDTLIDKNIYYVENPPTDEDFYNTVTKCWQTNDPLDFGWAINDVSANLVNLGLNVQPATKFSEIASAFSAGTLFMYHLGHGSSQNFDDGADYDGWEKPQFNTTSKSLGGLSITDNEYPILFSGACMTGWYDGEIDSFDSSNYESLAEVLTCIPNGVVAMFAPTRTSDFLATKELLQGILATIWPTYDASFYFSGTPNLGQILHHARWFLAEQAGLSSQRTTPHYELWHLFGDPELRLATRKPTEMQVTFPEKIGSVGEQTFFVGVTDEETDLPVSGAQIILSTGTMSLTDRSDDRGNAFFSFESPTHGLMDLFVIDDLHNPYHATILVTPTGANSSILPTCGSHEQPFLLNLSHYNPGEPVKLSFNGVVRRIVTVNQNGELIKEEIDFPYDLQFLEYTPINIVAFGQWSEVASVTLFEGIPNEPDLCLYSQWDQSTWDIEDRGFQMPSYPKWDNPDIWVGIGTQDLNRKDKYPAQIVGTHGLSDQLLYQIKVRIFNIGLAPAFQTTVKIEYSEFDIGQGDTWEEFSTRPINEIQGLDFQDVAFVFRPNQNNMNISLRVTVTNSEDSNEENNAGIENFAFFQITHYGANSREFAVNINNPSARPIGLSLRETAPGSVNEVGDSGFSGSEESTTVIVIIPPTIRCGDSQNYVVQGFVGTEPLEGVEIIAVKGWYIAPYLDQFGELIVFAIVMTIVLFALVLLYIAYRYW